MGGTRYKCRRRAVTSALNVLSSCSEHLQYLTVPNSTSVKARDDVLVPGMPRAFFATLDTEHRGGTVGGCLGPVL